MSQFLHSLRARFLIQPSERELWFIGLAAYAAKRSRDVTQVGAVIAGPDYVQRSLGWNGFPRGVNDSRRERSERPLKYIWTEHAERNAIYNAARTGVGTVGCTMFTQVFPCAGCARAIIQAGITTLYTSIPDWDPHSPELPENDWRRATPEVIEMFQEAHVALRLTERK